MPVTTAQPTRITPLSLAFQEGNEYIVYVYIEYVYIEYGISLSTRKIVGISTISRECHTTAQTRLLECTRKVIPEVTGRGEMFK